MVRIRFISFPKSPSNLNSYLCSWPIVFQSCRLELNGYEHLSSKIFTFNVFFCWERVHISWIEALCSSKIDGTWRTLFWQELQENWCKHFRTRKHKVMTSVMSSLYTSFCIHMLQSESSIYGGTSQHHKYLLKILLWHHHYLLSR